MVLMGHGTFNSNKIYFFLITKLIGCRKGLAKITAKSYHQDNRQGQSSRTDISDFKLECAKTFLIKFC